MLRIVKNINFLEKLKLTVPVRCHTANRIKQHKIMQKHVQVAKKVESVGQALGTKGYLRNFKPYTPQSDVNDKILSLCGTLNIPVSKTHRLDADQKFSLLNECFKELDHSVPNSELFEIKTLGDVLSFYNTPVDTTLPMDKTATNVPKNLHLIHEYKRFEPENDEMFGGQTAFPKSSTLVTGLKYRGKYKGHNAKRTWP